MDNSGEGVVRKVEESVRGRGDSMRGRGDRKARSEVSLMPSIEYKSIRSEASPVAAVLP